MHITPASAAFDLPRLGMRTYQHPLKRIMAIEERDGGVVISYTDPHPARGAA